MNRRNSEIHYVLEDLEFKGHSKYLVTCKTHDLMCRLVDRWALYSCGSDGRLHTWTWPSEGNSGGTITVYRVQGSDPEGKKPLEEPPEILPETQF